MGHERPTGGIQTIKASTITRITGYGPVTACDRLSRVWPVNHEKKKSKGYFFGSKPSKLVCI